MVDVRRPKSLWCQTVVIFIIRQETLLFLGYMQRGVEIRHASERDEWDNKTSSNSTRLPRTRSHDFFDLTPTASYPFLIHDAMISRTPCHVVSLSCIHAAAADLVK
jgi:hypothetical protein